MGQRKNLGVRGAALKKGVPLRQGDTIGIAGLGLPISKSDFERGVQCTKDLGFKSLVKGDPCNSLDSLGYVASVRDRVSVLEALLCDEQVKTVILSRAGQGGLMLLPNVDFGLIAAQGKLLVGLSDVSVLLHSVYRRTGLQVIHGPMIGPGFGKYRESSAAARSVDALLSLLRGELPDYRDIVLTPLSSHDSVEGRLVAGNLAATCALVGTPWAPQFRDHLVFLEDIREHPYRIHRMLTQMLLSGVFEGASGVVFGDFSNCYLKDYAVTVRKVAEAFASTVPFPVWWGFPLGHEDLNLPIPFGCKARISHNKLELLESPVLS